MGTRPEQAAPDSSSDTGNHKTVFPLRYFHSWIAVVCRIVGLTIVVVHHDAPAVLGRSRAGRPTTQLRDEKVFAGITTKEIFSQVEQVAATACAAPEGVYAHEEDRNSAH
jgi:hypothetical protein